MYRPQLKAEITICDEPLRSGNEMKNNKICLVCYSQFESIRRDALYCGEACRQKACHDKKRQKPALEVRNNLIGCDFGWSITKMCSRLTYRLEISKDVSGSIRSNNCVESKKASWNTNLYYLSASLSRIC